MNQRILMLLDRWTIFALLGLTGLSGCALVNSHEDRANAEPGNGPDAQGSGVTSPTQPSKESSPSEAPSSEPQATQLEKATAAVRSIDYIPFGYTGDGCWARSLYMGMESAVVGVELGAMFISSPDKKMLRVGTSDAAWHVAPVLAVGQNPKTAKHIIFDPSTLKEPVEINEWFRQLGYPTGGPDYVGVSFGPSVAYSMRDHFAAPILRLRNIFYVPDFVFEGDPPPPTPLPPGVHPEFEVPPVDPTVRYRMKDIQKSCMAMRVFIRKDSSTVNAVVKEKRLVTRTKELIGLLELKGRVERDMEFSEERCASAEQYLTIE